MGISPEETPEDSHKEDSLVILQQKRHGSVSLSEERPFIQKMN